MLLDAVCLVDASGRFVYVSAAFENIFGYPPEEAVGREMIDLVFPDDRARTLQAANEVKSGKPKTNFENRYVRKDGQVVHIMWSARWSEADQLRVAVARDITENKRTESLRHALYAISEVANATDDLQNLCRRVHEIIGGQVPAPNMLVALADRAREEVSVPYYSDQSGRLSEPGSLYTGQLAAQVIRTGAPLFVNPETEQAQTALAWSEIHQQAVGCVGIPLQTNTSTIGALVLDGSSVGANYKTRDRELLLLVASQVAAVIERNQMNARLRFMAQYDQLTGLANRALLSARLKTALARARRTQEHLSLLFIDLDKFKDVNDNFGHTTGDRLLQIVAQRLEQNVRKSDTIARIGGDEFAILLEGVDSQTQALEVGEKIQWALSQPILLEGCELSGRASIGVAFYPEHGRDEKQLLEYADKAMYAAKNKSVNRA